MTTSARAEALAYASDARCPECGGATDVTAIRVEGVVSILHRPGCRIERARRDAAGYPAPDAEMSDRIAVLFREPGQQESGPTAA